MDDAASGLLYLGALLALVGGVSMLLPLRALGITTRRRAVSACVIGLAAAGAAALLPATLSTVENHACKLDEFLPSYHFHEVHSTTVQADPTAVYAAIKAVTSAEITGFQTLTWLRSPHFGPVAPSLLAAPPDQPVLDVATRSGFLLLADQPAQEIVVGMIDFGPPLLAETRSADGFAKFDRPGYIKIAMNFTLAPTGGGASSVFTETRVFATDAAALRTFGAYWRAVRPGSAWIRSAWLRAIKARAEH